MKTKPNKIFKFSSLALSFLLVISLLSGIFYPDVLIERAYAVTALTNVTDTPTSTKISTSTSHKIDFTTYTTVPVDGKIVITFPAGFNVASAAFSAWSGFDGNKTVSVSGQVVTVTRTTGGTASTAGGKYITLSGIANTASVNTNYTVIVETQNSAAATLDGPTTSFYFSICTNACHTATYQIPWSSTVSASGKHTIQFTTASAIPADGKIKITFPAGFDISGATFDSWSNFDGGRTMAINGQVITITRDNTGTSKVAGAKYIVLNNIINHSTAGSAYYATLETTDSSDVNIEGPTGIRFSINNTGLGLKNTPWPMHSGNAQHTGRSSYAGPTYPALKWKYTAGGTLGVYNNPIIDSDGTIYIGDPGTVKYLRALNSDGTLKWSSLFSASPSSMPALNANNVLYVAASTALYALNSSDGSIAWQFAAGDTISPRSSPTIASDGTIYFSSKDYKTYALNPDGTLKWGYNTGIQSHWSAPSLSLDETAIYTNAQSNGKCYALNAGGILIWTNVNPALKCGDLTPVVGSDGTIYWKSVFPGVNRSLLSLNPINGNMNWYYNTNTANYEYTQPSLGSDDTIYMGSMNNKLYSFNHTNGTKNWEYDVAYQYWNTPLVDSNEIIYIGSGGTENKLYAINSAGAFKWSYKTGNTLSTAPAIDSDGTLYFTSSDKNLYALQPWTLTSSLNRSDYYNPGDTISFTATTSMLTTDPVTAEANQVQVYLSDGTIVPLTYASTNSSGNTVWTGTYTISSGKPDGTYTATFEASAVNVETDTTVHFASAPTNTNNTGITSAISYTVKKQSASAPSLDAPRPPDLPNSPEPVLADPDQKPTPPIASKYNPDGGFDLLLNGGAKTTTNPEIALFLFGGPDTKYMQISEDPTFKGAVQEKYTPHKHWQLKDNKLGKHTIYIRYLTLYDVPSETVSQSILLTKITPPSSPPSQTATPSAPICTTTIIKTGDTLWDLAVRYFTEGSLYPNLISLNKNTYSSLVTNPGYLRLGWEIKVECK